MTGRPCAARLPGGGTIGGFRRFSDYWSFAGPSEAEFNLLRRVVRPDSTVADVGANYGGFTVTMAGLARAGRVYSLQPAPSTFRILRDNVERNGLTNVETIRAAVGDTVGQLPFTDDTSVSARNRIASSAAVVGTAPVVQVDAIRLDRFCAEGKIDRLDFVKTDTEGFEPRVFRGAAELLKNRRIGLILAESCPLALADMGSNVREYVDAVESCGYGVFELRPSGKAGERLGPPALEQVWLQNVLIQPLLAS